MISMIDETSPTTKGAGRRPTLVKVLYLNTTGSLGGSELCLLDVMATMRRARPDWPLSLIVVHLWRRK